MNNKTEIIALKDIDTKEPEEIIIKNFNLINFRPRTVNYIAARPGHCKTQQLVNILIELGQIRTTDNKPKYNILFISLEMTKEDLARRTKKINPKGYQENIDMRQENILFCDKINLSIFELKNILIQYEFQNKKIDFLIIDYVQLFDETQEIISIEITKIAIEFNVIILSALQLNSSFNPREPMQAMSHIAGSNRYSKDATTIVLLYKQDHKTLIGYVPKNRHGITTDTGIEVELKENGEIEGASTFYSPTKLTEKTKIIYNIGQIIALIALRYGINGQMDYTKMDIIFDETQMRNDRTIALIYLSGALSVLLITRENLGEHADYAKNKIQAAINYEYEIETGKNIKEIIDDKEKEQKRKKDNEKIKNGRIALNEFISYNKTLIETIYDKIGKEITKTNEKLNLSHCQEILDICTEKGIENIQKLTDIASPLNNKGTTHINKTKKQEPEQE